MEYRIKKDVIGQNKLIPSMLHKNLSKYMMLESMVKRSVFKELDPSFVIDEDEEHLCVCAGFFEIDISKNFKIDGPLLFDVSCMNPLCSKNKNKEIGTIGISEISKKMKKQITEIYGYNENGDIIKQQVLDFGIYLKLKSETIPISCSIAIQENQENIDARLAMIDCIEYVIKNQIMEV